MRRKQFTLIELLMVIAIIGILIALLMPALSRAKEYAKRVQCVSQQNQLSAAYHGYVGEHDGIMPCPGEAECRTSVSTDEMITVGGRTRPRVEFTFYEWYEDGSWRDSNLGKWGEYIGYEGEGITHGVLWDYTGDIRIYRCPNETSELAYVSYSVPTHLNAHSADYRFYPFRHVQKMQEVADPSERFNFVEERDERIHTPRQTIDSQRPAGTYWNAGTFMPYVQWKGDWGGNPERHTDVSDWVIDNHMLGTVAAYVDGHVEYYKFKGFLTTTITAHFQHGYWEDVWWMARGAAPTDRWNHQPYHTPPYLTNTLN